MLNVALPKGRLGDKVYRLLKAAGYDGPITIEREISGEQQEKDIILARDILNGIIASL